MNRSRFDQCSSYINIAELSACSHDLLSFSSSKLCLITMIAHPFQKCHLLLLIRWRKTVPRLRIVWDQVHLYSEAAQVFCQRIGGFQRVIDSFQQYILDQNFRRGCLQYSSIAFFSSAMFHWRLTGMILFLISSVGVFTETAKFNAGSASLLMRKIASTLPLVEIVIRLGPNPSPPISVTATACITAS